MKRFWVQIANEASNTVMFTSVREKNSDAARWAIQNACTRAGAGWNTTGTVRTWEPITDGLVPFTRIVGSDSIATKEREPKPLGVVAAESK